MKNTSLHPGSFKTVKTILIAGALMGSASGVCHAGPAKSVPDLVTDRPDQTESPSVVPPGFVQLEAGWTHAVDDESGRKVTSDAGPETLLRIGFLTMLELRLGFLGFVNQDVEFAGVNQRSSGIADTEGGFKVSLLPANGWVPQTAVMAHVSLPTGETGFSSERADPSFRFAFAHDLSERVSVSYNLGAAWASEEVAPGEFTTLSVLEYTLTLGVGLTDQLGGYVEIFGDGALSASGGPATSLSSGFTYLVLDHLQLDLAGGVGASTNADDWFLGVGVSFRYPE